MNNKYLVLDLETNGLNPFEDSIVAVGFVSNYMYTDSKYLYKEQDFYGFVKIWLENLLQNTNILIGHNLPFDLLFLWKYEELLEWFKSGGRIWDTALAEYMLSGQTHKYPKLREIAVSKYGCPERIKWIDNLLFENKEAIKAGVRVSDLPKEKVLEDVQNDVQDTESVYLQQRKLAQRAGMEVLIELEMDALLATTEMKYNGMKINRKKLEENKAKLELELKEKEILLFKVVRQYWSI